MTPTRLTRHAAVRANQRGVTHQTVEAVFAWADVELPAGDGCSVLRFSRERLADRDLRATLGPLADKVCSLALVVAGDTGRVVTVLHDHGRPHGRHYRRAA
jgi:hypothetical protein